MRASRPTVRTALASLASLAALAALAALATLATARRPRALPPQARLDAALAVLGESRDRSPPACGGPRDAVRPVRIPVRSRRRERRRPVRSLRESLGISADGSEKAFSSADIQEMLTRKCPELEYSLRDPTKNTQHVFVAVDPSGGGASAFSIASICQSPGGFMHVRALHAHALALPQLAQQQHRTHEGVGVLRHAAHKGRRAERQHALLEVVHQRRVAGHKQLSERVVHVQREENGRTPGIDRVRAGRHRDQPPPLERGLAERNAVAPESRARFQRRHRQPQTRVQRRAQRVHAARAAQRRAEEQRAQRLLHRRAQILGVETLHTRDVRQTHKLLVNHINAIRAHAIFSHVQAVLIFESNLAFESQHLLHALSAAGVGNWVSMAEGQQGTLGWLTTSDRKEQMALLVRELLAQGRIAISTLFTSNELTLLNAKRQIEDELNCYAVVTEPPKTSFGKVRSRRFCPCVSPSSARSMHASFRCARRTPGSSTGNKTIFALLSSLLA